MDLNDNFAERSILSDKLSAAVDKGIGARYFCMAKIWLKPIKNNLGEQRAVDRGCISISNLLKVGVELVAL